MKILENGYLSTNIINLVVKNKISCYTRIEEVKNLQERIVNDIKFYFKTNEYNENLVLVLEYEGKYKKKHMIAVDEGHNFRTNNEKIKTEKFIDEYIKFLAYTLYFEYMD